jgi:SAM-dependent methyltransferase
VDDDPVRSGYEAFAPIYDDFTRNNDYEMWVGRAILPELEKHGLRHGRVLDVGCGTGRAFEPLLSRGWQIHGCDLSPRMIELAEREAGGKVALAVADMRELPVFGEFELVVSLNDPMNHLLGGNDLRRALSGIRANLAPGGLVVFDCTSRMIFETLFSVGGLRDVQYHGRRWTLRGAGEVEPMVFEYRLEGDDIEPFGLRERLWPQGEVESAIREAGLSCLAVLGMEEVEKEIVLTDPPDEDRQVKVIYIASRES